MRTLKLPRRHSEEEVGQFAGLFLGEDSYDLMVGGEDCDAYDAETGEPIFKYRTSAIPDEACREAYRNLRGMPPHVGNRGLAAGKKYQPARWRDADGRTWQLRKDGKRSKSSFSLVSNEAELAGAASSIIGFYERTARFPFCRATAFNLKHPDRFEKAMPFIRACDEVFRLHMPSRWQAQMERVGLTSQDFVIHGTAFTTITVNRNFRTALHRDMGDLKEGFGVMAVLRGGEYEGHYTCFPGHRVAVDMRASGDVLLFDSTLWHGNTPVHIRPGVPWRRISCVLYYRRDMIRCGTAEEELRISKNRQRGMTVWVDKPKARAATNTRKRKFYRDQLDVSKERKMAMPPKPWSQEKLVQDWKKMIRLGTESNDLTYSRTLLPHVIQKRGLDIEAACWLTVLSMTYYSPPIASRLIQETRPWAEVPRRFPWCRIHSSRRNLGISKNGIERHIASYIEAVKPFGSFYAWLTHDFTGEPLLDWKRAEKRVGKIWGNGRWSTYTTLEYLSVINGIPIETRSMGFEGATGPSDGIFVLFGADTFDPDELDVFGEKARALAMEECPDDPRAADYAYIESALCNYARMRYGNFYVGEHIDLEQDSFQWMMEKGAGMLHDLWETRPLRADARFRGEASGWEGSDLFRQEHYWHTGEVLAADQDRFVDFSERWPAE